MHSCRNIKGCKNNPILVSKKLGFVNLPQDERGVYFLFLDAKNSLLEVGDYFMELAYKS